MRAAIHITSSKFIKTLLVFVVCSIFSSAALVSNSFALDLSRDVFLVTSGQFTFGAYGASSCLNLINYDTVIRNGCANVADGVENLTVAFNNTPLTLLTGDFVQFFMYVGINALDNSSDSFLRNINLAVNNLNTVDVTFEQLNGSTGIVKITARAMSSFNLDYIPITASGGSVWLVLQPSEYISAGKITHWRIVPGVDYSNNIQSVVNAINNQTDYTQSLNSINNNINSVNNNLNNVNNNIQDLQETQEQANEDANDRYQDEKDTISGNGDDAQDSADSLDISFGVPWILQAWFSLFVDDSCASIPTISSWIHSNETRICSPWPSAVRSTLTPIFAVISGLLLFGFVIRWLRGGMFNNSIEVG